MKSRFLFPSHCKTLGFILFLTFLALFIAWQQFGFQFTFLSLGPPSQELFSFEDNNLTNEVAGVGLLVSLMLIAFAKQRVEDERTQVIRLESLQIAHYFNYAFFVVVLFAINGLSFLGTLIYLPYLFLLMFIIVFNVRLFLGAKFNDSEK